MNDRFRISSLLPERLREHGLALPAVLRQAGLPAGFFHQDKVYATRDEASVEAVYTQADGVEPDVLVDLVVRHAFVTLATDRPSFASLRREHAWRN